MGQVDLGIQRAAHFQRMDGCEGGQRFGGGSRLALGIEVPFGGYGAIRRGNGHREIPRAFGLAQRGDKLLGLLLVDGHIAIGLARHGTGRKRRGDCAVGTCRCRLRCQ